MKNKKCDIFVKNHFFKLKPVVDARFRSDISTRQ